MNLFKDTVTSENKIVGRFDTERLRSDEESFFSFVSSPWIKGGFFRAEKETYPAYLCANSGGGFPK